MAGHAQEINGEGIEREAIAGAFSIYKYLLWKNKGDKSKEDFFWFRNILASLPLDEEELLTRG